MTLQADNASGLLDFSNTHLTDIEQVDASGGNDTVVASDLDVANYSGQGGNDTMRPAPLTPPSTIPARWRQRL